MARGGHVVGVNLDVAEFLQALHFLIFIVCCACQIKRALQMLARFRDVASLIEKRTTLKRNFCLAFEACQRLIKRVCFVECSRGARNSSLSSVKNSHPQECGGISRITIGCFHVALNCLFEVVVFFIGTAKIDVNLGIVSCESN